MGRRERKKRRRSSEHPRLPGRNLGSVDVKMADLRKKKKERAGLLSWKKNSVQIGQDAHGRNGKERKRNLAQYLRRGRRPLRNLTPSRESGLTVEASAEGDKREKRGRKGNSSLGRGRGEKKRGGLAA